MGHCMSSGPTDEAVGWRSTSRDEERKVDIESALVVLHELVRRGGAAWDFTS